MNQRTTLEHIRVVIFDCDGVMFDSRRANNAYYNTILSHFGKPGLAEDDTTIVHMTTAEEAINHLFRNDPRLPEAHAYRLTLDYERFFGLMVMEPHLIEVLEALHARYYLALATNRTTTIRRVLEVFKLDGYFDLVVSALDVDKPKPDPEQVHKILGHFGLQPREALFVGDSLIDYEATRRAGVFFVAYKHSRLSADMHISDLRELTNLLGVTEEQGPMV